MEDVYPPIIFKLFVKIASNLIRRMVQSMFEGNVFFDAMKVFYDAALGVFFFVIKVFLNAIKVLLNNTIVRNAEQAVGGSVTFLYLGDRSELSVCYFDLSILHSYALDYYLNYIN